jgi:hypothetical protein
MCCKNNSSVINLIYSGQLLFSYSSYVASHHFNLAPHPCTKDQFYYIIYYITLNSNCEAQRVYEILKKNVKYIIGSQN